MVGDATTAVASATPASSSEEMGMTSINGTGGAAATSTTVASCLASPPRATRATSAPRWMASWVASSHVWGRDVALADSPMPRFTALVAVKVGSWVQRLVPKHKKTKVTKTPRVQSNYAHSLAAYPDRGTTSISTLGFRLLDPLRPVVGT